MATLVSEYRGRVVDFVGDNIVLGRIKEAQKAVWKLLSIKPAFTSTKRFTVQEFARSHP
jgi:hypothetical protein